VYALTFVPFFFVYFETAFFFGVFRGSAERRADQRSYQGYWHGSTSAGSLGDFNR
jgi:hypothetical protein